MDRPVTSKPRGICCYYSTPRGCFAGDNCKFLHGTDEKLSPYDKAKVCRYYARGHCARGAQCWFRHVLRKVTPDDERIQFNAESCCICLEKPTTYGLLTNCNHVSCLECIRRWRTPAGKSPGAVSSGTIKCCPLCRAPSRFITPSAHFFPNGGSRKKETIDAYKATMARVPCKYFEETSRTGKPCCPFGIDCFYQHTNADGTPHVFRHGAKHSMDVYWRRHRSRDPRFPVARFDYDDPIQFLQHIFDNPMINFPLDFIRASLPALMEGLTSGNEPENHNSAQDEEITEGVVDPLESLEDNLVTHDTATTPLSVAAEGDSPQATPVEPLPEQSQPPQTPSLPETRAASQPQHARLSSRFSTVMNAHSRQPFIIDISDDDEEEEEEESVQSTLDISDSAIESSDPPLLTSTPVSRLSPERQPTVFQSVGNPRTGTSLGRLQAEHDVDPPFMTDGRGRVVWSSTRNASGRGTTTEGRGSRHSRTGSAPRIACPSPSSTHLLSNTRGHAWDGQDAQGMDGKAGAGEGNTDVD